MNHIADIKTRIPAVTTRLRKGQLGRIGIIGGCQEYTGAPYFAAISALRTGADLAHVFCEADAARVIKSYSPDLIVHPLQRHDTTQLETTNGSSSTEIDRKNFKASRITATNSAAEQVIRQLPRLSALVIGPGLGRGTFMQDIAWISINESVKKGIPLIIDADGLWLVESCLMEFIEIIAQSEFSGMNAILTPNLAEFSRLLKQATHHGLVKEGQSPITAAADLASALSESGRVIILQKGLVDEISNGSITLSVSEYMNPKRSGGQGDVLAGSLATFVSWFPKSEACLACVAACLLTRHCALEAWEKSGRAMSVSKDVIPAIGSSFVKLFG